MNQFDKDQLRVNIKNGIAVIVLFLGVFTCYKVKCQSAEVQEILNSIHIEVKNSDTTEVIYVLLKEDYFEELNEDTFELIPYPYLETIYGYHVQNWKPYSVVFYDLKWNIIEEPLYIKKRKLFKKQKQK